MELLRIVAMIFVLLDHADFCAIGYPLAEELRSAPVISVVRVWIQALTVVCVNVFVLISGYFGIRPSVRGVANFAFQIMFWRVVIAAVAAVAGFAPTRMIIKNIEPFSGDWFSPCYMLLMVVAPALNAFVDKTDASSMRRYLLIFFGLQTVFGWISSQIYSHGFSLISMIGLYLLGRYIKLHVTEEKRKSLGVLRPLSAYLAITFLNMSGYCIGMILFENTSMSFVVNYSFSAYSSPVNIAASLALVIAFSNINLSSRLVNSIAKSAYSVMLIHLNPLVYGFYLAMWSYIYEAEGALCWLMLLLPGCILVYMSGTLVDRLRIFAWNAIMFYSHKRGNYVANKT